MSINYPRKREETSPKRTPAPLRKRHVEDRFHNVRTYTRPTVIDSVSSLVGGAAGSPWMWMIVSAAADSHV